MCLRICNAPLWGRHWNFGFHKMRGISWLAEEPSYEGLCFVVWILFKTSLRRSVIGERYVVWFAETVLGIPKDICLNLPHYITLKHGIICCNRTLLSPSRSAHTDQLWWFPNFITVYINTAGTSSLTLILLTWRIGWAHNNARK